MGTFHMRAVMFILALVGVVINLSIMAILGGHGHSHGEGGHDHGHGHGHSHSHGQGHGEKHSHNGHAHAGVRTLCSQRWCGTLCSNFHL